MKDTLSQLESVTTCTPHGIPEHSINVIIFLGNNIILHALYHVSLCVLRGCIFLFISSFRRTQLETLTGITPYLWKCRYIVNCEVVIQYRNCQRRQVFKQCCTRGSAYCNVMAPGTGMWLSASPPAQTCFDKEQPLLVGRKNMAVSTSALLLYFEHVFTICTSSTENKPIFKIKNTRLI